MKKKWMEYLGLADLRYVEEADPEKFKKQKRKILAPVIAACACLALVFANLWLFLPKSVEAGDISAHRDSEYYSVIEKLNLMSAKYPDYKNNAAMLLDKLTLNGNGDYAVGDGVHWEGEIEEDAAPPTDEGAAGSDEYGDITDNQVEGVTEADLIKRTQTHIYYFDQNILRVFSIEGEDSKELGSFAVSGKVNLSDREFYISDDGKTLSVIFTENRFGEDRCVTLLSLDAENPQDIKIKNKFRISGKYISSRKIGSEILLINEFRVDLEKADFNDESTFLPQIDTGAGFESIKPENIIAPERLLDARYTVIVKLGEESLEQLGSRAYLSYSQNVYVSRDNIYLTRVFDGRESTDEGYQKIYAKTEISVLSYKDGFEHLGSATVDGYVKDQYSMDEYNGILRAVTTTNERFVTASNKNYYEQPSYLSSVLTTAMGKSNANLYCIDLESFETVGSVIRFAPDYEEVQSVRFDSDTAYVCTSVEMSDPVFFFDLSDLSNIAYKDTGTIAGYSTSLVNFGNGFLLGIGVGGFGSFKLEVYEESADGVRSVCAYEIATAEYSTKYKSYYIDRENGIVGLGITDYTQSEYEKTSRYVVVFFDGYELTEILNVQLDGDNADKRAALIDGYMYLFGKNCFKVEKTVN